MKMKTFAALMVSGALMFSLAACGKKEEPAPAPAPAPAEAPATTPAPAMGGATTAHK
jgi:predicted small lipoprotein YifL